MRETACAEFLAALPAEWQAVISPCTKHTDNVGNGSGQASNVTATSDKVWLLSEFEVHGYIPQGQGHSSANQWEQGHQAQYEYYRSHPKVRHRHDDAGTACRWWLRSPMGASASAFCEVDQDGWPNTYGKAWSWGFSPCFAVS